MLSIVLIIADIILLGLLIATRVSLNCPESNSPVSHPTKGAQERKNLAIVNFVFAGLFFILAFIYTTLNREGGSYYKNVNLSGLTQTPGKLPARYPMIFDIAIRAFSVVAGILLIVNGIALLDCKNSKKWDWLKITDWIFIALLAGAIIYCITIRIYYTVKRRNKNKKGDSDIELATAPVPKKVK